MANAKVDWSTVNAELDQVRTQLESLNVNAEVCGKWIWISGDTRRYSQKLRKFGCQFSADKRMWFFVPPSLPQKEKDEDDDERLSIDEIRRFHGSNTFQKAKAFNKSASKKSSNTSNTGSFNLLDVISRLFMLCTVVYR